MRLFNKRGYTLGDLQSIILILVTLAVVIGAGVYALTQFQSQIGAATTAQTMAANNVTKGITDLATWIPIIAVIIAAALIIGIVVRSFNSGTA